MVRLRRYGLALTALALLAGACEVDAKTRAAECRRACADRVAACVAGGERRGRCTRRLVRACRHDGPGVCTPAAAGDPGRVRFVKAANSSFDRYTASPTAAEAEWMRSHYWRMLAYAPYFDSRLAWYPDAWVYQDLYAVYVDGDVAASHPDWILTDGNGQRLYIPYGCAGGTCPQYAGDVGNPAFRAWWIAEAKRHLDAGYRGLFVDDVNLALKVGDGSGATVAPFDPRRGRPMSVDEWRSYVVEFVEEIRAALPAAEIVHNHVWFAAPTSDPLVQRALAAADVIEIERGFNDTGIRGGSGQYGFETLAAYVDAVHALGHSVLLDVEVPWGAEYALATYFLVTSGNDALSNGPTGLPDAWWPANDVELGAPRGGRYTWNGLVRRDFEGGVVLVNPPDQPERTVVLGDTYRSLDGAPRTSITLGPTEGSVLRTR